MLSPVVPYSLLKMHWTPEHAQPLSQWPEQHLDVSSTTSSPGHKSELYPGRGRSYSYSWANDDISALTASNLLKRYAEKYSAALDSPYERLPAGPYSASVPFAGLSGPKGELEPWPLSHDGAYLEGITGTKVEAASAPPPGGSSASLANSGLSDPGYSGSSSCSGPPSHEYPSTYSGTYLSSGYCPQPASTLPPVSLHALQTTSTLVPGYTPPGPVYNFSHQTSLTSGYAHTPTPYLPSGLAAPTPLPSRPAVVGRSYGYQNHSLGGPEPGASVKRKSFEMTAENEDGDGLRYRKYGYDHVRSGGGSPYSVGDPSECHGNGLSSANADTLVFKSGKPRSPTGLGGAELAKYSGLKPLVSPPYRGAREYSPPANLTGENGGGEHGFPTHHLSQSSKRLERTNSRLVELVNGELQDHSPPLPWGELVGHAHVKAALEEDLLWPILRPGLVSHPSQTVLLFGPQGGGKTTLTRSLASQLGATFFHLSGAALASKWKAEGEDLLHTLFLVASARQPSVVLLSQVEALAEEGLQQALLSHLEAARRGASGTMVVVVATRRPDLLPDAAYQAFSKRYYVDLPDATGRKQALLQALGPQGCRLSEQELRTLLHRTEGFSVRKLLQLCQQAVAAAATSPPVPLHGLPRPLAFKDFENAFCKVHPDASPKEPDTCMEWSRATSH